METWRSIKDYDNYEVSDEGRVRNAKTGRVLKPGINDNGYPIVVLMNNGMRNTKKIHQLVAKSFINNNQEGLVVDHLDGNKQNNKLSNLEYCTSSENNRRAYELGLKTPVHVYDQPNSRRVRVVETGKVYDSINECARDIGANHRHISDCLNGKLQKHHNYHYETVD